MEIVKNDLQAIHFASILFAELLDLPGSHSQSRHHPLPVRKHAVIIITNKYQFFLPLFCPAEDSDQVVATVEENLMDGMLV